MAYYRRFFALKGIDRQCLGQGAVGRCVIEKLSESEGRVFLYAQGLKPINTKLNFVFDEGGALAFEMVSFLPLGGRVDRKWSFNKANIADRNIEDIAAVMLVMEGKTAMSASCRADFSLSRVKQFSFREKTEEKTCEKNEESEIEQEEIPQEKVDYSLMVKQIVKKFGENIEDIKKLVGKDIFDKHQSIRPFEDDRSWVKISLKDLVYIGDDNWKLASNPFVALGCKKFKHLILGKDKAGNLFLGVPCNYKPEFRLEAAIQGFSFNSPAPGEFCYGIKQIT